MANFLSCVVTVAVLQTIVQTAAGAKILLVSTLAKSHIHELQCIGDEMVRRGHQVSVYLPSYFDSKTSSLVNIINYNFPEEYRIQFDTAMANIQSGNWKPNSNMFDFFFNTRDKAKAMCWGLFADKEKLDYLKQERFDLAIVTALPFSQCLFCLPYYLNIPTVAVGTIIAEWHSGMPLQSATYPLLFSLSSNKMNFFERFTNFLMNIISPFLFSIMVVPDMSKIDPILSNIDADKLVQQAVLYLENTDPIFDYPKAVFPNFVHVGGLTVKPPKALNNELEEFIDRSPKGIIFVSFGTLAPVQSAPKAMVENMMAALHQSGFNVLMKSDSDHTEENIKFSKWLPQSDILAHPKTKLFISHCGKNGLFESIYHGVPIICTPRAVDQPKNSKRVAELAIGILLDFSFASVKEISKAINDGLYNETFRRNMKRLSQLFHDRPETPVERAANAIEHVLKYGGEHLAPAIKHPSTIQYFYADVWLTIYAVLFILFYILYKCCQKLKTGVYRLGKLKQN